MTAPDRKPCPFCGEADQETLMIQHLEGTILRPAYRVCCDNCGASTRYSDLGDHVAIWNARATPAAMTPEVPEEWIAAAANAVWLELMDSEKSRWTFRREHVHNAIARTLAALRAGGDA